MVSLIGKAVKTSKGVTYRHECRKCNKSWFSEDRLEEHDCSGGESKGLGDRLELYLKSVGVTEDRYKEVKEKFGLPPKCGCAKRKRWLNAVGSHLGIK